MSYITSSDLLLFQNKVIDETEENLALLNSYCRAAEQEIKKYLNYDPESQDYTSKILSDGGELLELEAMPITALTAVTVDGEETDVTLYEYKADRPYIRMVDFSPFTKGSVYEVEYTAGYTDSNFPEVIKITALQLASLIWESSGGNLAVSSTSFADNGSRVFNNFTADRFLKQLAMYKRELV